MKKIGIFLMMVVSIMSLRESELLKKATQADRYLYVQSEID